MCAWLSHIWILYGTVCSESRCALRLQCIVIAHACWMN